MIIKGLSSFLVAQFPPGRVVRVCRGDATILGVVFADLREWCSGIAPTTVLRVVNGVASRRRDVVDEVDGGRLEVIVDGRMSLIVCVLLVTMALHVTARSHRDG